MRKICVALFLSLFVSLIHASVMPIELSENQSHRQVLKVDTSAHYCDEVVNNTLGNNTNPSCSGINYHCCLGFVIVPSVDVDLSVAISANLIPYSSLLILQPIINFIYKPPKT